MAVLKNYYITRTIQQVKRTDRPLPSDWKQRVLFIAERDGNKCVMCSKSDSEVPCTAHHIIARDLGGSHAYHNLIYLCGKCHDIAEVEELSEFQIKNYIPHTEELIDEEKHLSIMDRVFSRHPEIESEINRVVEERVKLWRQPHIING